MEIIESDLSGQISEAMAELDMKANEIHRLRALFKATFEQLQRKDSIIKALEKKLKTFKNRKE